MKAGNRPLRVLLLNSHINAGGIARYLLHLATGLKKQGHEVTVASSGGNWEWKFQKNGIRLLTLPLATKSIVSPRILFSLAALEKFVNACPVDIVHGNNRVSQFVSFLLWKRRRIPYVSTFHGFYRPHLVRKWVQCPGLRTIAISRSAAQHLHEDLKITSEAIRVVYNGTDPDEFKVTLSVEAIRAKYGIQGRPVIGVLARLTPEKNHALVIKAFKCILTDFPDAVLLLAGDGRLEKRLKALAVSHKLQGHVLFLKDVEAGEILSILDVCVHAALSEGFGLVITEAGMKGVPVIASNQGGMNEIVLDGVTGMLLQNYEDPAELADKLGRLLADEGLKKRMAEKARERAHAFFSAAQMTAGTLEVYYEVLSV